MKCIICDKELDKEKGDYGHCEVTFGYGSRFDQVYNFVHAGRSKEIYIACICDDCFETKQNEFEIYDIKTKTEYKKKDKCSADYELEMLEQMMKKTKD